MARFKVNRIDVVRNRYAFQQDVIAIGPGAIPGRTLLQLSVGGVGGFSDFTKTLVSTVNYGENYPDWRFRLARGEPCTTYMSVDDYRVTDHQMQNIQENIHTGVHPSTGQPWLQVNNFIGGSILPVEVVNGNNILLPSQFRWNDNVLDRNFQEALNAFLVEASTASEVQGAIFFAELGKLRSSIVKNAESMVKGFHSFADTIQNLKRLIRSPTKLRREIASKYLEVNFAYLTAARDIREAYKEMTLLVSRPPIQLVSVTRDSAGKHHRDPSTWETTYKRQVVASLPMNLGPNYATYLERGHTWCTIKGGVKPSLYGPPPDSKLVRYGFNPTDVLSYAWELTKFSWVIDYFIPIGEMLAVDWDIRSRISWNSCNRGYEAWGEYINESEALYPQGYQDIALKDWSYTPKRPYLNSRISHKRIVRRHLQPSELNFQLYARTIERPKQLLNLIALLSQRL